MSIWRHESKREKGSEGLVKESSSVVGLLLLFLFVVVNSGSRGPFSHKYSEG